MIGYRSSPPGLGLLTAEITWRQSPLNVTLKIWRSQHTNNSFLRSEASTKAGERRTFIRQPKETKTSPVESLIKPPSPVEFVAELTAASQFAHYITYSHEDDNHM